MEKLKNIWFRLVAPSLLKEIESIKNNYNTILDAYCNQAKELYKIKFELCVSQQKCLEWEERAKTQNIDSAVAVQVIRERMREMPMNQSILSARDRAATQRIYELESEVTKLRKLLREKN